MDWWVGGWWMREWIHGRMKRWVDGWMDARWMDGLMDGWVGGWIVGGGWMDE